MWCAGLIIGALFAAPAIASIHRAVTAPTTDFSRPEAFERNPGGATTTQRIEGRTVFSQMAANLPFEARMQYSLGEAIFSRAWVAAPSSTLATDGLGPFYNARACNRCHIRNGRGHTPDPALPNDSAISLLARLSVPPQTAEQANALRDGRLSAQPDPVYGAQLQDLAIAGHPAEGRLDIRYTEQPFTLADDTVISLRAPAYAIDAPAYGPPDPDLMLSVRIAPQMIGLGLLEMIDEVDIMAAADPLDRDGDGISGRPNRVWDETHGALALGRFGWKAGQPTLAQQNAVALLGDIGLSSPLYPDAAGDCTAAQSRCQAAPNGNSPQFDDVEVPALMTEPLEFYTAHLAVPARRAIEDPLVLRGKEAFYESGCTACHTPKFVTLTDPARPALSHQLIWPYSDLLLHDMGAGLADGRPEGRADGREWRTPPLWGIGLLHQANGAAFYLHDGRARSLTEAILWHDGEAADARDAFAAMPAEGRDAMLAFLNSL